MFRRAPAGVNGVPNAVFWDFVRGWDEYFTCGSGTGGRGSSVRSRGVFGEIAEAAELLGDALNCRFSGGFSGGVAALERAGLSDFEAESWGWKGGRGQRAGE